MTVIFDDGTEIECVSMYPTDDGCMILVDVYGEDHTISIKDIFEVVAQ